jgi:hypothetical protein
MLFGRVTVRWSFGSIPEYQRMFLLITSKLVISFWSVALICVLSLKTVGYAVVEQSMYMAFYFLNDAILQISYFFVLFECFNVLVNDQSVQQTSAFVRIP